jgi:leucyl-tRNA synthetase
VHIGSGAELREEWVAPQEVRWVRGKPVAPEAEIDLEEVVEKMSKSRGNVVNPDDVIAEYGADAMRLYEMFIGPLHKAAPWSIEGMPGVFRFLQRAYRLFVDEEEAGDRLRELPEAPGSDAQQRLLARTIDAATRDFEALAFNTSISQLMVFVRDIEKDGRIPLSIGEAFLRLLAPLAPHLCEELWARRGHAETIAYEPWPEADPALLVEDEVEIVVQVRGKVRAKLRVPADAEEAAVCELALAQPNVQKYLGDQTPKRVIYVPGRLVNVVI